MAYASKHGRRPNEYASKSAHSYIIRDPALQNFLRNCQLPKRAEEVSIPKEIAHPYEAVNPNPIKHVIAVDGGYTIVSVEDEFPSSILCFFQLGPLVFSVKDLEELDDQPFIDPADIAKLKRIQRLEFFLPIRNLTYKERGSLTESIRLALFDFFCSTVDEGQLLDTLRWFLFQEYTSSPRQIWKLANCPICGKGDVPLQYKKMLDNGRTPCPNCGGELFLTDVFRLHEAVDEEFGAGGIPGYVITAVEQLIIVHLIRLILNTKPDLLKQILFIKDGPLAFFGQTANMHKPMRELVTFLFEHHALFLAGLEKSGPFVEHADEIASKLERGSILILDNDYIYRFVMPGQADPANPYGRTTYYSNKLIFKTLADDIYVVSVPTTDVLPKPTKNDLHNLDIILSNINKLKCDMYDNALIPVALANKLVSLADHPSSKILQKFAIDTIK